MKKLIAMLIVLCLSLCSCADISNLPQNTGSTLEPTTTTIATPAPTEIVVDPTTSATTADPTASVVDPTEQPTQAPTQAPSGNTETPAPTTVAPTQAPTQAPTNNTTQAPTQATTKETTKATTKATTAAKPTTKATTTTKPTTKATTKATTTTKPTTKTTTAVVNNVFINNTNVVFEENQVTIRPKHVRWEGNTLVAECFVINGLYKPVYNIDVSMLRFSNASGVIADGNFGRMQGATIGARSYIVWTFTFGPNVILQNNGNLSSLICQNNLRYNY